MGAAPALNGVHYTLPYLDYLLAKVPVEVEIAQRGGPGLMAVRGSLIRI